MTSAPASATPNGQLTLATPLPGATALPDTAWLAQVQPCTHYVDPAAGTPALPGPGDSGPGTNAQPWQSLGHAAAVLTSGQTACARAGTYAESGVYLANSGTATAPIALRGLSGATVVPPTSPSTADRATFQFDASNGRSLSYWLVEGFTVDKSSGSSADTAARDGAGFTVVSSGSGAINHVAIRDNVVKNGKAGMGVLVRSVGNTGGGKVADVLVEGNEVTNFSRWKASDGTFHKAWASGRTRMDANALSIEGSGAVAAESVARLQAKRNSFHDNGGDAVQCLTDNDADTAVTNPLGDPVDIDLVDNRVVNTPGSAPIEENAVDVKSCRQVSIRGTDPPTTTGPAVTWNKFAELLPTRLAVDAPGNNSNGDAVVLHYRARRVLIDNLRIWNTCSGISIGRAGTRVDNVVVRRVLVFGLRYGKALGGGTAAETTADATRCRGNGVFATGVTGLDITHVTMDDVPGSGIGLSGYDGPVDDVDVWNSIVRLRTPTGVVSGVPAATPRWIAMTTVSGIATDSVDSNRNVFWHADDPNAATGAYFTNGSNLALAAWRTAGRDQLSPVADPQFVTDPVTNDYYTVTTSPARDLALANTGVTGCGTGPDSGFRESC
ncbi:hypothetical protein [Umezawaea sp. Da 62-37]|uniref:hypothetical protein n=1 Tax=Umezawaea sp. Da 62-37 TaxID=3075927 RepID=UPI0028F73CD4|nr:hypothetical protein [Umezawaea sp. Da 62-37]WNV88049.1 hypothetical protein RM788_07105 [Umezawaea sp. Da 62-37]